MAIYESAEDYLERILILSEHMEHVRKIDIVNDMGFSKPFCYYRNEEVRDEFLYSN